MAVINTKTIFNSHSILFIMNHHEAQVNVTLKSKDEFQNGNSTL